MANKLTYSKTTRIINATAAGTSVITPSTGVDMLGFDGVLFVAMLGTLTAGQVTSLQAGDSTTNGSFSAITGAVTAAMLDADSNKCLVLDVFHPQKRFITPILNRATQNAVIDGVIAIQYAGKKAPTVQDATTVSQSKFFVGI